MSNQAKKKEKRPLIDNESDSGPDDRGQAPKGAKKDSMPVSKSSKGNEKPSWDLGMNKWVKVQEYNGRTYIDIREHYVDKNTMETKPGKKGITLNCQQFQKLKTIIDEIDHELPWSGRVFR